LVFDDLAVDDVAQAALERTSRFGVLPSLILPW
jgi:hypothetical protein